MIKTSADIPPVEAATYKKLKTPSAVASAEGDGYTTTAPMKKAKAQKPSGQFGLPRSGKGLKSIPMKGC